MTNTHPSEHEYRTIKNIAADAYRDYLNGGKVDFNAAVQESAEEARQKLRQRAAQMALEDLGISKKEYLHLIMHHSRRPQNRMWWQRIHRKFIRTLFNKFGQFS
jgi:hypothetical protein